jgi:hypothetical protein
MGIIAECIRKRSQRMSGVVMTWGASLLTTGRVFSFTGSDRTVGHERVSGPETTVLQNAAQPCTTFTPTVSGSFTFAILDGSRDFYPDDAANALTFRRERISGPETTVLQSAYLALATFTPTIAGTRVFRLSFSDSAAAPTIGVAVAPTVRDHQAVVCKQHI